jgi:predicted glycoside hydrolase/deacetylase ChbG (UPF0249 family)
MHPNPVLRELGYSDTDRVVIIHADDIGMCQATVMAMDGLWNAGIVSSMAAMAVCPWFPAAAEYSRAHPAADVGLHFTLTCEWESYRWGPVSTRSPASGLIDAEGNFHRTSEPPQRKGTAAAVRSELQAQLKRAQAAGIDLTHVDSHMLTVWHHNFLPAYFQVPASCGIPSFFVRPDITGAIPFVGGKKTAAAAARWSKAMERRGLPLFDHVFIMPLENADDRIGAAKRALAELPPGLTYFILHPACDTPELRAIAPDWQCRAADYEAFTSRELDGFVKQSGIQVIGWKTLRDLFRGRR